MDLYCFFIDAGPSCSTRHLTYIYTIYFNVKNNNKYEVCKNLTSRINKLAIYGVRRLDIIHFFSPHDTTSIIQIIHVSQIVKFKTVQW